MAYENWDEDPSYANNMCASRIRVIVEVEVEHHCDQEPCDYLTQGILEEEFERLIEAKEWEDV